MKTEQLTGVGLVLQSSFGNYFPALGEVRIEARSRTPVFVVSGVLSTGYIQLEEAVRAVLVELKVPLAKSTPVQSSGPVHNVRMVRLH
jgi:hypothetical protein